MYGKFHFHSLFEKCTDDAEEDLIVWKRLECIITAFLFPLPIISRKHESTGDFVEHHSVAIQYISVLFHHKPNKW